MKCLEQALGIAGTECILSIVVVSQCQGCVGCGRTQDGKTGDNGVLFTISVFKLSLKCYWWSDSCIMRIINTKKIMSLEHP